MPWTNLPTRSSGYTMTAASDWNPAVNNFAFLRQVALVQFVSDVTVTSTTEGGQLVVSSGAISYENVLHKIEFGCPSFVTPGSGTMFISLYDSTTQVGRIVQIAAVPPEVPGAVMPVYLTPTAASHTYTIKAHISTAGTATVRAGAGGAATRMPGYIRISRVPT